MSNQCHGLTLAQRIDARSIPEPNTGCGLWEGATTRSGHPQISVGNRIVRAHRVAWELAHGTIPDGLCVCHKCDTPQCVNPDHLFLGTVGDNTRDMVRKGRGVAPEGERNGNARLTIAAVRLVLDASGPAQAIATRLGLSPSTVRDIRIGRTWRSVPGTRSSRADRNGNARLQWADVHRIRAMCASDSTLTSAAVGRLFGVGRMAIQRIRDGVTWTTGARGEPST